MVRAPDGDERRRIMTDHIEVGRRYPEITINTAYSFGLDDQEFVVSFEGDDPGEFLDLVQELRATESSAYTLRDTPIFTCVAMSRRAARSTRSTAPPTSRLRARRRLTRIGPTATLAAHEQTGRSERAPARRDRRLRAGGLLRRRGSPQDPSVNVEVDMFDRLPTPFGLVRAGVAPDHPKIKSVIRVYEKTAGARRLPLLRQRRGRP